MSDRQHLRAIAMRAAVDLGIPAEAFADDIEAILEDIRDYIASGRGDAIDAALHVARQRGIAV